MQPLLVVDRLETSFFTKVGQLRAVDGVSYQIAAGETVGIVGESGCGKTVASLSILGLIAAPGKITGGDIRFMGKSIPKMSDEELRQLRGGSIAMIFQEPMTALNPVLTVGRQITEQILAHEKVSASEARHRAVDLLTLVGIPAPDKRVDQYPFELSGGMRQRAMIAMSLSCHPKLLIADEPTTALDVTIQAQILDLLCELQERFGMAIQFITHDLGVISEVSDRVVVMYGGRVAEEAPTARIFSAPKHPYTVGLMNSVPRIDRQCEKLANIPGTVPPLQRMPPGCRFQNRCSRATDECRRTVPPLIEIAPGHKLACFNPY